MLTRKTSRIAGIKKLVSIPVLLIALLLGTKTAIYAIDDGKTITYNGNTIEFSDKPAIDTIYVEDPITGEISMSISERAPEPIKLNGERIYTYGDLNRRSRELSDVPTSQPGATLQIVKTYLLTNMDDFISRLDDGIYHFKLNHIIIDNAGSVVYYNLSPLQYQKAPNKIAEKTTEQLSRSFKNAAEKVLKESPRYRAAVFEGHSVNSMLYNGFTLNFTVKDGKLEQI